MDTSNSSRKAVIGIIVVIMLVIAATAVIVMGTDNGESTESESVSEQGAPSSVSPGVSPKVNPDAQATNAFKDGTYSATGTYQTPGGRESIDVTVTLAEGAITDATVEQNARGGEAAEYQSKFVSGYKTQVIGKKIDEVNLSRVAGSSLTSNGFNNAIQDIENQAKT